MKLNNIIATGLILTGINLLSGCSLVYDLAQENAQNQYKS